MAADPWELICHHHYTGIPGVVMDLCPLGSSHARSEGLSDADFLTEGMSSQSGAVRITRDRQNIRIPADTPQWRRLGGLRGEVTFYRLPTTLGMNTLLSGTAISLSLWNDRLSFWFSNEHLDQSVSSFDHAVGSPSTFPHERWLKVGFMYDGFSTMELSLFGEVIARRTGLFGPVIAPDHEGVVIGNDINGDRPGIHIDEVKIWRSNPDFVPDDFFTRPIDGSTGDCWRRFLIKLEDALRQDRKCSAYVAGVIEQAIANVKKAVFDRGPADWESVQRLVEEYKRLWASGAIDGDEMTAVFSNLSGYLQNIGAHPGQDPVLPGLFETECFSRILQEVGPLDCDGRFLAMLLNAGLANGLEKQAGVADSGRS